MLGLSDILDRFHRQKTRTVQLCQAHQRCVSREHDIFYVISTFLNICVNCTITFYVVDGLRFTVQAPVTNIGCGIQRVGRETAESLLGRQVDKMNNYQFTCSTVPSLFSPIKRD